MRYVGSIDQGTTSTRFVIFAEDGSFVASAQREHRQIYPRPGWVEHDAEEIWKNTESLIIEGLDKAGLEGGDLSAIGITNQRETIVPFSRKTGKPVYNAIVWQDLRGEEYIKELSSRLPESTVREHTGLLYSPYFSYFIHFFNSFLTIWYIIIAPEIEALRLSTFFIIGIEIDLVHN